MAKSNLDTDSEILFHKNTTVFIKTKRLKEKKIIETKGIQNETKSKTTGPFSSESTSSAAISCDSLISPLALPTAAELHAVPMVTGTQTLPRIATVS